MSDLSEYYGIDLVVALRDHTYSPRMILSRLVSLPDGSALVASLQGAPRGWGVDRHLLATLIDAMQNNTWVTHAVATQKKPKKPKKIWRPTPKRARKKRQLSVGDLLERQRKSEEVRDG